MKKAVKYIVLSISCVACAFIVFIMAGLLLDIGNLLNPLTLLVPMLAFMVLLASFILFTVWGFKFSNNKPHVTPFVVAISLFAGSFLLFAIGNVVNNAMEHTAAKPIEVKNGLIDISVEEFKTSFNNHIGDAYKTIDSFEELIDDESAFYACELEDGVSFAIRATPDSKMIQGIILTLDMENDNKNSTAMGYYWSKLIYTLMPNISKNEILDMSEDLDMENPYPGDKDFTEKNDMLFGNTVSTEMITLSVFAK